MLAHILYALPIRSRRSLIRRHFLERFFQPFDYLFHPRRSDSPHLAFRLTRLNQPHRGSVLVAPDFGSVSPRSLSCRETQIKLSSLSLDRDRLPSLVPTSATSLA